MKTRGLGFIFQPTYRDKTTGEKKTVVTWWISYSIHGQRHKENAKSANRADGVRLLKQRIGEAAQGRPVGSQIDRTTFDDLAQMLFDDYRANGRRSLDRAEQACAHLRDFFGAASRARDISADVITKYKARRLDERAKPSTVNYELAMLRRAFRLAIRAGKVALRPEVKMLRVDNARTGFFEPEQYRAVVDASSPTISNRSRRPHISLAGAPRASC